MLNKIRNRLSAPLGHVFVSSRVDDAYICAYPRSGSTWLRTILVNIIDPSADSNPDVFNARIPAVSIRNAKSINSLESPRLIMTHSCWRPVINKSVYLVRDGRDSFISSYYYHTVRQGATLDLEQYLDRYISREYGVTWAEHTESWLNAGRSTLSDQLHMIRFEDMKKNTHEVIRGICEFLNIDTNDNTIVTAIDKASLHNVRKIERRRQAMDVNGSSSFYRGGRVEQWKDPKYSEVIKAFELHFNSALKCATYL